MKYYRKTKIIDKGQPTEFTYTEDYIINLPINKPIYGFAYDVNNDTEHRRLNCLPVLGEIIHNKSCNRWSNYVFVPYKKGTKQKCKSGIVDFNSRTYADTYEEAVEMFNELVQKRIDELNRMANEAIKDMIK